VIEANEALADAPESVNDSPYENGWICKIRLSDAVELEGLLDADSYATHAEEEEH
jgi:glycine cleavage system H protein